MVVIKHGGSVLAKADGGGVVDTFAEDVVLLASVGMKPVVIHGGGPEIGRWAARLGKESVFLDGLRVTDAETLEIARMVLVGKVNRELVVAINTRGASAVGLSGEDARLITAAPRGGGLGFVGNVVRVDPTLLNRLLSEGVIPVVATIGVDEAGQAYNINADHVAAAVAGALKAEKLVFLTDVEGIRADPADPATLLPTVSAREVVEMIEAGRIQGGMVPKAQACLAAVEAGVGRAHILDGRQRHALLLEMFTAEGVGTMVEP